MTAVRSLLLPFRQVKNFAATARRFAAPHEDVQLPRPADRTEVVAIGTDAAKVMRLLL